MCYCQILIFLLLGLHYVNSQFGQLFEGDTCKETSDGVKHTCKRINDCQSAFDILRNDEKPEICGYDGFTAIVCCKPDERKDSPPPPTTTVREPPPKMKPNKPTSGFKTVSEKKCDEYKAHVYQKPSVRPLVSFPGEEENRKESTCGISERPLIILGEPTSPREFPHQANIGYRYGRQIKWLCTGSLISEDFILSAAHCSRTSYGIPRVAVVGDLDTESDTDDAKPEQYDIVEIIDHPMYNSDRPYNDIALFRLGKNVKFDGYKRPACLNTVRNITEKQAIATGWGNTRAGGSPSNHLQKVRLDIIPKSTCSQYWFAGGSVKRGIDDERMICAGDLTGGKDTCQGDSGGPLQNQLLDPFCMYSIIGVTAFGKSCGINVPGVYTRVSHYVPWIESVVWPNE